MSSVLTVQAGFVSPPIPVNQYSVVQVAPNASPGSVSVLYSQDSDTYIRAGTATWTAWPNGSVTSSSAMMSAARMFIQVSAQSSAATVSVSDPTPGVEEIVQSPWAGAEAGSMIFSSSVTFQGQILGSITGANSTAAFPAYSFVGNTSTGIYSRAVGSINMAVAGVEQLSLVSGQFVGLGLQIGFGPSNTAANSPDIFLTRDAADVLAIKHGNSSETLRIYGTSSQRMILTHDGTNSVVSTSIGGINLSASTMAFFGVAVTTRPNVSSAVTTTAGTSTVPFGFATAQQFQDTVNAVNALQNALKQLGLSA